MEDWKKVVQASLVLGIVAVGIRAYFVYQERHAPMVTKSTAENAGGYHPTADDYTYLRQLHPESPKDIATLLGKTVWTQIADQLPYFPVQGTRVDYAHQVGVLRGATPLAVTGMIQQVEPHGHRHPRPSRRQAGPRCLQAPQHSRRHRNLRGARWLSRRQRLDLSRGPVLLL